MIDIALTKRNPINGKFGIPWDGRGNWITDDSEEWAVVSRLTERRNAYHQDVDGTYGSRLREVRSLSSRTPSQVIAFAREALAPLITANRIILLDLSVTQQTLNNRVRLAVTWTRPGGAAPKTTFVAL